ncbi:MAG: hypothetical protein AAGG68_09940 [Bacteroidota bacterium]
MRHKNYSISNLSSHLFWDVDHAQLSFEKSAIYLIERVAYLGNLKDWLLLRDVYGNEKLKEVILNMRSLDDKSLHYYSLIFNIPKEAFRCYKNKQLQGIPSYF